MRFGLQNSPAILGRETLLHEITRDLKFLGNFGTVRPKFSRKMWNEFFSLSRGKFRSHEIFREIWNRSSGRQISRKFRSREISQEIWNRSSGAVFRNFQKILGSKISWKFWGRKFILLFAPTSPPQPVPKFSGNFGTGFFLLSSPSPNFAGNFGAGIWRLFSAFWAPKFSGNFGTGDAASRDYTRPEISGKCWNDFFIISRQISGKFRSHEIFREIWNRSSGRQISGKFRSHEISREIWNRNF